MGNFLLVCVKVSLLFATQWTLEIPEPRITEDTLQYFVTLLSDI